MDYPPLKPHTHDGTNSDQLDLKKSVYNAPQTALTSATGTTAGGTYTATEQNLINNHTTRLNELETKLRALGLIL